MRNAYFATGPSACRATGNPACFIRLLKWDLLWMRLGQVRVLYSPWYTVANLGQQTCDHESNMDESDLNSAKHGHVSRLSHT